jgi:hypothetical protein
MNDAMHRWSRQTEPVECATAEAEYVDALSFLAQGRLLPKDGAKSNATAHFNKLSFALNSYTP